MSIVGKGSDDHLARKEVTEEDVYQAIIYNAKIMAQIDPTSLSQNILIILLSK